MHDMLWDSTVTMVKRQIMVFRIRKQTCYPPLLNKLLIMWPQRPENQTHYPPLLKKQLTMWTQRVKAHHRRILSHRHQMGQASPFLRQMPQTSLLFLLQGFQLSRGHNLQPHLRLPQRRNLTYRLLLRVLVTLWYLRWQPLVHLRLRQW